MFHFFQAITNKNGDALVGYYVKVADSVGNVVPLYADSSGTPIVNVSGLADTAKVDTNGNASFYVNPGEYTLNIYAPDATTLYLPVPDMPMGLNTITIASGSSVSTIAGLQGIALPVANQSAILTLAGREGTFVFDSSDLSAKVTADTAQGIYVPPSSDTTGASGAWVRKFDGNPNVTHFGAVGDGVTDDLTALNRAVATCSALGLRHLDFAPRTYNVSSTFSCSAGNIVLHGSGATVSSAMTTGTPLLSLTGNNIEVRGLHLYQSAAAGGSNWVVEVTGNNVKLLDGTKLEKPEGTDGTMMYIRAGVTGFRMIGCETAGSNGFNVFGLKDAVFAFNRFIERAAGGDDAIALKAIRGQGDGVAENVLIAHNYFENCAAFCSIGSEIGSGGANDSTRSAGVRGVQLIGNRGKNCTSILYIKPGQIQDYRDGFVKGVTCSDNTLIDATGAKMEHVINIAPGRGGSVEDVKGKNNRAIGRTDWSGGAAVGYRIYIQDDTGVGSSPSKISDIDVGLTLFDPYLGAAAGGSAPGAPFFEAAEVSYANTAYGSISKIVVDAECNGTSSAGIAVQFNLDDAVFVRRAKLSNINTSAASTVGGILARSRITVGTDITIDMANGQPYYFPTAGSGEVRCPELDEQVYFGTQGATAAPTLAAWLSKRRSVLMSVDMLTSNGFAQDATNYTQIRLANMELAGTTFGTWDSQTAAANGTNRRSAVTANVITPIYRRRDVTVAADQLQALFARDGRLLVTKSNGFGTGQPLNDTRFIIRSAPY